MMFFILAWITFGVAVWADHFFELRKHPLVRPGFVDLFILILIAPILYIYNMIDKGIK